MGLLNVVANSDSEVQPHMIATPADMAARIMSPSEAAKLLTSGDGRETRRGAA